MVSRLDIYNFKSCQKEPLSLQISSHSSDYSKPEVLVWHHLSLLLIFHFFYLKNYLVLHFGHWVFLALCGLFSSCGGDPLLAGCVGFSPWRLPLLRAQALGAWASVFVALGLSCCCSVCLELAGFSSCDVQPQ